MTDVIAVSDVPVDRIVEVVGRAESSSEHPLGRAMYKFAEGYGADCSSGSDGFKAVPGRGLECTIDADRVRIGNKASKYAHLPTCLSTCPPVRASRGALCVERSHPPPGLQLMRAAPGVLVCLFACLFVLQAWMEEGAIAVGHEIQAAMQSLQVEGKTAMLLSVGSEVVAVVAVADMIRSVKP